MTADGRRFLCVGAAHWDIIARADGPVATGDDLPGRVQRRPGGVALNIAAGLAERGCRVSLAAVIGSDEAGLSLMRYAGQCGIDCSRVRQVEAPTDTYVAVENRTGELVAAVADANLLDSHAGHLADMALDGVTTVVLEGNLPPSVISRIAGSASACGIEIAANPVSPAKATRLAGLLGGAHRPVIIANLAEANVLTGRADRTARDAAQALADAGAAEALVTHGSAEAALFSGGTLFAAEPPRVAGDASVTGAGDALCAAFLASPDRNTDPQSALDDALRAAADKMQGR